MIIADKNKITDFVLLPSVLYSSQNNVFYMFFVASQ